MKDNNKDYALDTLERLIEASKDGSSLIEDKKDFKGSFAERYARK